MNEVIYALFHREEMDVLDFQKVINLTHLFNVYKFSDGFKEYSVFEEMTNDLHIWGNSHNIKSVFQAEIIV